MPLRYSSCLSGVFFNFKFFLPRLESGVLNKGGTWNIKIALVDMQIVVWGFIMRWVLRKKVEMKKRLLLCEGLCSGESALAENLHQNLRELFIGCFINTMSGLKIPYGQKFWKSACNCRVFMRWKPILTPRWTSTALRELPTPPSSPGKPPAKSPAPHHLPVGSPPAKLTDRPSSRHGRPLREPDCLIS